MSDSESLFGDDEPKSFIKEGGNPWKETDVCKGSEFKKFGDMRKPKTSIAAGADLTKDIVYDNIGFGTDSEGVIKYVVRDTVSVIAATGKPVVICYIPEETAVDVFVKHCEDSAVTDSIVANENKDERGLMLPAYVYDRMVKARKQKEEEEAEKAKAAAKAAAEAEKAAAEKAEAEAEKEKAEKEKAAAKAEAEEKKKKKAAAAAEKAAAEKKAAAAAEEKTVDEAGAEAGTEAEEGEDADGDVVLFQTKADVTSAAKQTKSAIGDDEFKAMRDGLRAIAAHVMSNEGGVTKNQVVGTLRSSGVSESSIEAYISFGKPVVAATPSSSSAGKKRRGSTSDDKPAPKKQKKGSSAPTEEQMDVDTDAAVVAAATETSSAAMSAPNADVDTADVEPLAVEDATSTTNTKVAVSQKKTAGGSGMVGSVSAASRVVKKTPSSSSATTSAVFQNILGLTKMDKFGDADFAAIRGETGDGHLLRTDKELHAACKRLVDDPSTRLGALVRRHVGIKPNEDPVPYQKALMDDFVMVAGAAVKTVVSLANAEAQK